jgi:hypothetical protein
MKQLGGRKVRRILPFASGVAAGAALLAVAMTVAAQAPQQTAKDQGETDIYGAVLADIQARNWTKAITDLDTWSQKYPDTQFKEMQLFGYEQAYAQMNPPNQAKALDMANQLLDKDMDKAFPGAPQAPLTIYFLAIQSAHTLGQNATPDQLAIGDKAAHKLLDYAPKYFTDKNKPAPVSAADWENARKQVEQGANDFLYYEAILPAEKARLAKDCPAAEAGYIKALGAYPDKSYLVYQLGLAYSCQKKMPQAAWEFARTAAMDPTLSGTNPKPATVTEYAKKYYTNLHGNAEGYDEFVEKAKASLLPPDGFTIVNVDAQKADAINKWNDEHKEAAIWAGLKGSLTAPDGAAYFDSNMKDAAFPPMKGTLMEAVPGCRPKSLLVSVPSFDNAKPPAEITLKFAAALTGKPEVGGEITFSDAVSKTFTATPFMVTMEVEKDKVQGLTMTPCAATPTKKGVTKKK